MTAIDATFVLTDRHDAGAVLAWLQHQLAAIMEVPAGEIDVDQPVLEMGADSIVLVEAVAIVQDIFKVRLRIRQFADELNTLRRLATHLAGEPTAPSNEVNGSAVGRRPASPPDPPRPVITAPEPPRPVIDLRAPAPIQTPNTVNHANTVEPSDGSHPAPVPPIRTGHFMTTPVIGTDAKPDQVRDGAERAHRWFPTETDAPPRPQIDHSDFEEEFCARTPGSKRHVDAFRAWHADPRASAGFRPSSKETLYPITLSRAAGSHIRDIDGNDYVDLTMGFGSLLFGHNHPDIAQSVALQLENGIGIGPAAYLAGPVAQKLCELTGMDRAAFVTTGTEAVMTAVRLARHATGRTRIAMFRGAYHGFWDGTVVLPGQSPGSALAAVDGIPPRVGQEVLLLPWDDDAALELVDRHADELACVLVEPVQSRRPHLQPRALVAQLGALTQRHDIPLIFDEMITGFRLGPDGAAGFYGVQPQMATYGKILGGGLPVGCVAGDRRYLDAVDGGTWQYGDESRPTAETTFMAGTYAKHPLAMAAASAVLGKVADPGLYDALERRAASLQAEANSILQHAEADIAIERCASILRFSSSSNIDRFFESMIMNGVYIWEGRTCFLSSAHDDNDVARVLEAVEQSAACARRKAVAPASRTMPPDVGAPRIVQVLPLTSNQREIWTGRRISTDIGDALHNLVAVRLTGRVDERLLEEAVNLVVARHDSMRVVFDSDGTEQRVVSSVHVPLERAEFGCAAELERFLARPDLRAFDFEAGPLWRFIMAEESSNISHLVVSCSELMADGASIGIVLDDVAAAYTALLRGTVPQWREPLQVGDYLVACATADYRQLVTASKEFWAAELLGAPSTPPLPARSARPPIKGSNIERIHAVVPATLADQLRDAAKREGGTLFALLLSAFASLVHRASGRRDLIIGVPTLGRFIPGAERLVTNCARPMPIRIQIEKTDTLSQLMRETQRKVMDAQDNAACTTSDVARCARLPRDVSAAPLFQLAFNLDPVTAPPDFGGLLRGELEPVPERHGIMDLSVQITPTGAGDLLVNFDYDPDLFEDATVRTWLACFESILASASATTSIAIERLPLRGTT